MLKHLPLSSVFATKTMRHLFDKKKYFFQIILFCLFISLGCSAGKHPHKKHKTRKMKACDCPTFGFNQARFPIFYAVKYYNPEQCTYYQGY